MRKVLYKNSPFPRFYVQLVQLVPGHCFKMNNLRKLRITLEYHKAGGSVRESNLQVVGLLQLWPCLKYCGFSMTGIRVIPITTASGPASSVQGLMMPWFT